MMKKGIPPLSRDYTRRRLERAMGIEPTLVAWEATVLPLNYARAVELILGAVISSQQLIE